MKTLQDTANSKKKRNDLPTTFHSLDEIPTNIFSNESEEYIPNDNDYSSPIITPMD